ncbi:MULTISPECIES: LppP/LprE family lipoprotein [unclassified Frankia]|uniref:LppP/LprE family lipoprotein n=1 Tax=unclassified Frankia TaxID=2632575 RepID=UPI00404482A2
MAARSPCYAGKGQSRTASSGHDQRLAGQPVVPRYDLYDPADRIRCPSAGTADVTFRWDGTKLNVDPPTIPQATPPPTAAAADPEQGTERVCKWLLQRPLTYSFP